MRCRPFQMKLLLPCWRLTVSRWEEGRNRSCSESSLSAGGKPAMEGIVAILPDGVTRGS